MISIYCWFSKESHINTLLGTFLSQRGSHYLGKWGFSFIRVLCYKAVLDCLNYYNKIPQIGWFVNNRNGFIFSHFWRLEVQDQDVSRADVFEASSLACRRCLPVSSHGLPSVGVCFPISSYKDTSHNGLGSTLVIPF